MTATILILGGILVIAVALALELLRVSRAPHALDPAWLQQGLSDPEVYRPMTRLFARQDLVFVSSWRGSRKLVRRLRRERRAVMTLFLRQMRGDFHRVWSLCRLLAPVSQSPELGVLLIRQFVYFHAMYGALRLRCLIGWHGYAEFEIQGLVATLDHLRSCAASALQGSEAPAWQPAGTRVS